ncbi:MAG: hypothetical protein RMJ98_00165 [Myxococcales bacterium]|nr:hypothetical protein [Myxococcales bacterium]
MGLEAYASDLNPVAVLINKAMIEIPPRFAGRPPVNPDARRNIGHGGSWRGAQGLAEDVRYYGKWMRDEAERRIGHLYPPVEVTAEMAKERPDLKPYVGNKLTVIAWLWARTVKSPNPAFRNVEVPLASTFMLSTKAGKEAYVEPVIENAGYRFTVKVGKPKDAEAKNGTSAGKRAAFRCLMSAAPITYDYVRSEGRAGRMSARLMAIVAEGERGRVYLPPTPEHEAAAREAKPDWKSETALPDRALGFRVQEYGMTRWADLFTPRQIVALTTFSDLVGEAMERVRSDALAAGLPNDGMPLRDGGTGAQAYAEATGVYLACGISRSSDFWSNLCIWANQPKNELVAHLFSRQAIPMAWDYAEANPFSESGGNFEKNVSYVTKGLHFLPAKSPGHSSQEDATSNTFCRGRLVATDPPYYDNISYAALSDFFYVWLRKTLEPTYPDLFRTLLTPKAEELVATPYRHGSKEKAEAFFLEGMTRALSRIAEQAHPGFPTTIYYAFKQSENEQDEGVASTGWETFLEAVISSGFAVSGTWPMRTERTQGLKGDTNALASSIVLVCRKRPDDAPTTTRREFLSSLKRELPVALAELQKANIAPVDLAQAAIGPGMAVYTRYARVLDAEGKPVTVREALALINQILDEALAEQEGDFDADSRWALAWFEQHGFSEGEFGVAETLSKAKNTSISGLVEAGILQSKRGKVRLLTPDELPADWDPATDERLTVWEMAHQLIRVLESGGEAAAAALAARLGARAETARELAYRLHTVSERNKRPRDALRYNALVQSGPRSQGLLAKATVEQSRHRFLERMNRISRANRDASQSREGG